MPFKVKEHFRKTKSGKLARVKESNRSRAKKALLALTTVGLGALAYKKLGSKLVKGAVSVSGKADDVAANKATDITQLLTPKKLTTSAKSYKTLPDPWLEGSTTISKAKKVLTTGKKETKLLTGSKYRAEDIPDPWNSKVKVSRLNRKQRKLTTNTKSKEKVLLLKKGSYDAPDYISPTPSSNVTGRGKNLGAEIRSKRALVRREPADIKYANERLKISTKYKNSDSPSLQQTGANYERAANERLTIIAKRSPSRKQTGLVTTRGSASKDSVRSAKTYNPNKPTEPIKPKKKGKSRRDLLTGKTPQELTDNFIESSTKSAIVKAGDTVSDAIIPGSSIVNRTIRDVKSRAKQVERLSNELAESGDKVSGRRGFLKKAVKKTAKEASLKPRDAENAARGALTRSKNTAVKVLRTGTRGEVKYKVHKKWHPFQAWEETKTRVYRKPQGLLDKISQGMRKAARYKSGRYYDAPDL